NVRDTQPSNSSSTMMVSQALMMARINAPALAACWARLPGKVSENTSSARIKYEPSNCPSQQTTEISNVPTATAGSTADFTTAAMKGWLVTRRGGVSGSAD